MAALQQRRLARSVCLDHTSTLLRAFSHQLLASWQRTHALMLTHFSKQSPRETNCGECLLLVAWLMVIFQFVVGHLSLHPYMLSPYMKLPGLPFPWTLSPSAVGVTSFVMFYVSVEQHNTTGMYHQELEPHIFITGFWVSHFYLILESIVYYIVSKV